MLDTLSGSAESPGRGRRPAPGQARGHSLCGTPSFMARPPPSPHAHRPSGVKGLALAFTVLVIYVLVLFVRPQEWVSFLYALPIVDYLMAATALLWLWDLRLRRWRFGQAPQDWLMLGLYAGVLMSHVRHTYFAAFLVSFGDFGKKFLPYLFIASLVNTLRRTKVIIAAIVVGCLFLSVHGIIQAHSEDHTGFGETRQSEAIVRQEDGEEMVRVRGFGIFFDPNDLALILVVALPFLLSRGLSRGAGSIGGRALSLALTVPMLYCIYLTNSRGGWLALMAMAAAYLYLHVPYKKTAAVVGLAVAVAIFTLGPTRMATISAEEGAARGRLVAWADGNRMLKRYPVFGQGHDRFEEFSEDGRSAHNSFVQCWGELGLFGYFFWLAMVLATLKDSYALSGAEAEEQELEDQEARRTARDLPRLARAGLAGLVGFLVAGFFLTRTYHLPLYVLFGLFAGMRNTYARRAGTLEGAFVMRDCRYVFAAELLSIPALYVMIRFLLS